MSLLPFLFEYEHPRSILDHVLGLPPDDVLTAVATPIRSGDYYRPWRHLAAVVPRDAGSSIKSDADKYQINLDVQHFSHFSGKTADGYIMVEGKHEEKQDEYRYTSRHFIRRYALTEGKPETVESKLSSDCVLTVTAPKKPQPALAGQSAVPIT